MPGEVEVPRRRVVLRSARRASLTATRPLLVRPGEGLEPTDALELGFVRRWDGSWDDVGVVVAPAWCESYPPEVPAAVARGIPVVASTRAGGVVAPGDVDGFVAAVLEAAPRSKGLGRGATPGGW